MSYFSKDDLRSTPSTKDGIEYEIESQYRQEGARFIMDIGQRMELGYNTIATGVTYFHRFYMVHSFLLYPHYFTACCALFLAGKVEETPKRAKDMIEMAKRILPAAEFVKFGEDPREELIIMERKFLQSIKFNLEEEHPYSYLLKYSKYLQNRSRSSPDIEAILQMAWTFVNDSFSTTLCLQWEPEIIAVAVLHLAAKISKYDIDNSVHNATRTHWWEEFIEGLMKDHLDDICHQVLDLYSHSEESSSMKSDKSYSSDRQLLHAPNTSSHSIKNTPSQKSVPIPSVSHGAIEVSPPTLTNTVLPTVSNSEENNSITNIHQPALNVSHPPPLPEVPPPSMGTLPQDTSTTPSMYPIPSVCHSATEVLPPMPMNTVLPTFSNPPPISIDLITSIYHPAPNILQQPPPVYSVPPPSLPLLGAPLYDTSAPPPGQYSTIPTHYISSAYDSYSQYGFNY